MKYHHKFLRYWVYVILMCGVTAGIAEGWNCGDPDNGCDIIAAIAFIKKWNYESDCNCDLVSAIAIGMIIPAYIPLVIPSLISMYISRYINDYITHLP